MFIVGVPWLLTQTIPPVRWGLGRYRQGARVTFSLPLFLRSSRLICMLAVLDARWVARLDEGKTSVYMATSERKTPVEKIGVGADLVTR
jgi:precorrin-4 methylase